MNRTTHAFHDNAPQGTPVELQLIEREARRLRAEHAGDLLTRLVIALDLRMRSVAHRIAAAVLGS